MPGLVGLIAGRRLDAGGQLIEIHDLLTPQLILYILILLIPTAVMFSSAEMLAALAAHSYREAQSYLQPGSMVVTIPVLLAALAELDPRGWSAVVPILNVANLVFEALLGDLHPTALIYVTLANGGFALIAAAITVWSFRRGTLALAN